MARTLEEIFAAVNAEASVHEALDEGGSGEGVFDRVWSGALHEEDWFVVKVGEGLEESEKNYPITAVYHFLQGLANALGGASARIRIRIDILPGEDA